jgi:hypothetical protein
MKSMMGKFVSLVKGKKDPEVVRKEVRAEMSRLDEGLYSLEFDMKKMRKERERIIQKGVRAAKEGDAVLKQEAALDLKSMNAELAYMQMNRSNVVKTKMLHRISLRRLTSALPGGTQPSTTIRRSKICWKTVNATRNVFRNCSTRRPTP